MGRWAVISSRSKTQKDTEAECGDLGPAAAPPGPGELGMEAGGWGLRTGGGETQSACGLQANEPSVQYLLSCQYSLGPVP